MKVFSSQFKNLHSGKILFAVFSIIISYFSAVDGGDFDVYIEASHKLFHGQNPYLPPYAKDGMGYSYSPFFIILLIPFTSSYFWTEFLWCLLMCLLLYRSYVLFFHYLKNPQFSSYYKKVWTWLILIFSIQFIINNLGMVQVTIFLLWAILESTRLVQNRKEIYGGILLGVVINIKIMPFVMLGYFFYRGYFKAFFTAILTSFLLLFSPSLFWGLDYNLVLLSDWWHIINPNKIEYQIDGAIGKHSMMSFLPVYLSESLGELPFRRNIFSFSPMVAVQITQASIVVLGLLSLFYFRSRPFVKEKNPLKSIWEISYFLLLIPLIMPHQQKYAFILVIPMIAYLFYYYLMTKAWKESVHDKFIFGIFILAILVYSPIHGSDIIGWEAFRWSQHYRLLTIGTLMLIPISMYCKPNKIDYSN